MKYCLPFRAVILHLGVYSLRVTNPFAAGLNPLDLHALSTLPAFTLSQDQTLNRRFFATTHYCAAYPVFFYGVFLNSSFAYAIGKVQLIRLAGSKKRGSRQRHSLA